VTTARILLIDDDVELLDMLEAYLEREELAVTVANGRSWDASLGFVYVAPFDVRLPKSTEEDDLVDTVVQPDVLEPASINASFSIVCDT
jgi:DNA-binding NtrC family response regulator